MHAKEPTDTNGLKITEKSERFIEIGVFRLKEIKVYEWAGPYNGMGDASINSMFFHLFMSFIGVSKYYIFLYSSLNKKSSSHSII